MTEQTPRERIEAFAQAHKLTMAAVFVPFSQSPNAKPREDGKVWRSLNWRVTLSRDGRPFLETTYGAGEAHCPAYKAKGYDLSRSGYSDSVARAKLIEWECENGRAGMFYGHGDGINGKRNSALLPDFPDVLYSLAHDADALDHPTFEDWASDYGYEPDSRKAEAIYRACLEIGLTCRSALGEDGLAALREACQDY